jgi:hypothetical protein
MRRCRIRWPEGPLTVLRRELPSLVLRASNASIDATEIEDMRDEDIRSVAVASLKLRNKYGGEISWAPEPRHAGHRQSSATPGYLSKLA